MKLVTFGIDRNLIIQFPISVQLYTQQLLILYQLEQYQFPLQIKINMQILTHLEIDKPHIGLNSETYVLIRHKNSEHAEDWL